MGTLHVSPQIPMHVSPKGIMIFMDYSISYAQQFPKSVTK